mmetsp:Transcript_930/g.2080  ORF Transcript_930/g.2080 Transcript_930/m.2080 type:complete len:211 (-) Transcript_930:57-689(-)
MLTMLQCSNLFEPMCTWLLPCSEPVVDAMELTEPHSNELSMELVREFVRENEHLDACLLTGVLGLLIGVAVPPSADDIKKSRQSCNLLSSTCHVLSSVISAAITFPSADGASPGSSSKPLVACGQVVASGDSSPAGLGPRAASFGGTSSQEVTWRGCSLSTSPSDGIPASACRALGGVTSTTAELMSTHGLQGPAPIATAAGRGQLCPRN